MKKAMKAWYLAGMLCAGFGIGARAEVREFDFKDPKGVNAISFILDGLVEPIIGFASGMSGKVQADLSDPAKTTGRIDVAADSFSFANPGMADHLKSEAWLHAEKFPVISFEMKKVTNLDQLEAAGEGVTYRAQVAGSFTCRGVTRDIEVPVQITHLPGRLGDRMKGASGDLLILRANFSIKRTDYGIQPQLPPVAVADEIRIHVAIAGAAPGPVTPKEKVDLIDGPALTAWSKFLADAGADPANTWSVKDGVIHCTGKPNGYLKTQKTYENYRLHVEWRWADKAGNSGVILHMSGPDKIWPKSIEAQLRSGDAGDFYVIDGTTFKEHQGVEGRRVPKKNPSNEKPVGEWNEMDVICAGDSIEVRVNGLLQNKATQASVRSGHILLQSEGAPIEFRNVHLRPLE